MKNSVFGDDTKQNAIVNTRVIILLIQGWFWHPTHGTAGKMEEEMTLMRASVSVDCLEVRWENWLANSRLKGNARSGRWRKSCLLRGGYIDDPVSSSKSSSLDGAD
jgi:hypothetical protein